MIKTEKITTFSGNLPHHYQMGSIVWENIVILGNSLMLLASRGFHKHTALAIMPILASGTLLHENKKIPVTPVRIEPRISDSKALLPISSSLWKAVVKGQIVR